MNFQAIYTEVANLRFNSSTTKIAQVKNWVNLAEVEVWRAFDWPFRQATTMANVSMSLASGEASGTMPADFEKAIAVFEPTQGDEMDWMEPSDYRRDFQALVTKPAGMADYYTILPKSDGGKTMFVAPAQTGTFKVDYKRSYTKLVSGAETTGVMSHDTNDTPLWSSEFHYILVPWAIEIGAILGKEPPPKEYAKLRDDILAQMVEAYSTVVSRPIRIWGR